MGSCSAKLQLSPDTVLELGMKQNKDGHESITFDLLKLQSSKQQYDAHSQATIDHLVSCHVDRLQRSVSPAVIIDPNA